MEHEQSDLQKQHYKIVIDAYIDHIDTLYIDDNTLQWYWHGDYTPAGQTIISTWLNGTQVLNDVSWTPNWDNSPWSDVFVGLNPPFLTNVDTWSSMSFGAVCQTTGRGDSEFTWPDAGNGYKLTVTLYDAPSPTYPNAWWAGGAWYTITFICDYTPTQGDRWSGFLGQETGVYKWESAPG